MNFKKEAKIMAAILAAPLFLGLVIGLVGPKIIEKSCDNRLVPRYRSPDDKYEMVLFQRDCGATTGFLSQISILKAGKELPRRKGNIFIADDGDKRMPFGAWGGPLIEIKWTANDDVLVEYPEGSRVFLNEKQYEKVHIAYRTR